MKRRIPYALLLFLVMAVSACTNGADPEAAARTGARSPAEENSSVKDTPTIEKATAEPTKAPEQPSAAEFLPVIGPAPSWQNDVWINSEALPLEDLRGKVVLLEFWTFG